MSILEEVKGFDWTQIVELPEASDEWFKGKQILNFFPLDTYYKDTPEMEEFVKNEFKDATPLDTDADTMRFASDNVAIKGFYLEMGVARGNTINFIAALNSKNRIYGFDSFEGLPEDWDCGDIDVPKGTFKFKSKEMMPPVLHNVSLFKGLFKDTLPEFKKRILKDNPIAFLHIDCDIYSSTCDVFNYLGDNIVSGTIIIFDEYYNYSTFKEHEYKAFNEFLQKRNKKAKIIAFNQYFEQAVAQIL